MSTTMPLVRGPYRKKTKTKTKTMTMTMTMLAAAIGMRRNVFLVSSTKKKVDASFFTFVDR
jgi:hypothetical protein